MKVGFIKNDYNLCIGKGDTSSDSSAANGLIKHIRAFYGFMDEVREKHPMLIIENCGSGGMREDYGALSHFHLQSSSDQETYHNYPSILIGSLAGVLPEQLGIWAYPYPLLFSDINQPEVLTSDKYQDGMKNGEQTIFNLVNGLCGNLYLSGHLEVADKLNMDLIKEGICLYKKERAHIHNSYPFMPIGFNCINNKNSWAAVALANKENTRLLLAVWRLGSADEFKELPLYGWEGKCAVITQIYPEKGYEIETYYNRVKGVLTVHMPDTYTARYFQIEIKI